MILSRDFLRRAKTQFAYESYDNYHKRVFNENHHCIRNTADLIFFCHTVT